MGILLKVEEVWKKNSLYVKLKGEWISILLKIELCSWVTLMDTWVGILMVLMGFVEGMV